MGRSGEYGVGCVRFSGASVALCNAIMIHAVGFVHMGGWRHTILFGSPLGRVLGECV